MSSEVEISTEVEAAAVAAPDAGAAAADGRGAPAASCARAGFVALIGRANVGKSTLLNGLLGDRLAIVTPKAHTTRRPLRGILNLAGSQVVLVDTPGVGRENQALGRAMRQATVQAAAAADVALVVLAAGRRGNPEVLSAGDRDALALAASSGRPLVVALNKVDRLPDRRVMLPVMAAVARLHDPAAIVPVSALRGRNLGALLEEVVACLPAGSPLFPLDMQTDQAERVLCEELIFEQLLRRLQQEVPHQTAVVIESFEDHRDLPAGRCRVTARVVVERQAHKGIVIGAGGSMLREVGRAARLAVERLLGCPVYLALRVAVLPGWSRRPAALREVGLLGDGS